MLGNLLGDFVKGKNFNAIPKIYHEGILLHRRIDFFTDHNAHVLELQHRIQNELPKVSGISVDLVFDHLLARNWDRFAEVPLELFLDRFFDFALQHTEELPEMFTRFITSMAREKYMYKYNELLFLERAGNYLSQKIKHPNQLHRTREVYENHVEEFQKAFFRFMDDAKDVF